MTTEGEIHLVQNEEESGSSGLFLVGLFGDVRGGASHSSGSTDNVGVPLGAIDTFVRQDLLQPVVFSTPINYRQGENGRQDAMTINSLTNVELWVSLDVP